MEISLLKSLVNSITSFFQLPSREGIKCEPVEKYHQRIQERLKLLKPILDAIVDGEIATDEMLQKLAELHQSVDELREIFEKEHPLMSKVYFVLRVESLMKKIETYCLDIPELLKSSDQFLAAKLNASPLEHCVWKLKHIGHGEISSAIMKAIEDHVDGYEASSDGLAVISDSLSLKTSQELLIEAVALEKLKEIAERAENSGEVEYINHLIALVTHMHEHLLTTKLSQTCNSVSVPAYFYCPLSLELMVDPVIVASGQTYERAFIQKWIDLGLTVCPKTRQPLSHTTLTPNSIVKGLIAKWHESDNMKLPAAEKYGGIRRANHSTIPYLTDSLSSPRKSLLSFKIPQAGLSTSHPRSLSEGSLPRAAVNGKNTLDTERISKGSGEEISDHSGEKFELSVSRGTCGDGNEVASKAAACHSDASGELMSETQPAASLRSPLREPGLASPLETASQGQAVGLEASEISVSSLVSTPAEVENHVRSLVDDLTSTSIDAQRNATAGLRLLAKHDKDNRIIIANCGAISLLVNLLHSSDSKVQENAVTALLNLSINARNKTAIANFDAIEPLIHVLETGSEEAKQNSAATLYSLSDIEENKIKIGRSKAIKPLVELLGNGTPGGQKDALKALFNLSKFQENQIRIVQAGAVKYLIELIDPAAGMVDKAVALLSNLATTFEGRARIGQDGGIPVLVEVIELGAARDKENAAAALLQLCTKSGRYCRMALSEGVIPPLVALTSSGTSRAKEKARALLNHLRNQRHSH